MKLTGTIDSMPALISLPHALVADGRQCSYAPFLRGETLGAYIHRTGITIARGAVAVFHNGCRVPDELWDRLIPRDGDQVIVRARAEGGGGGSKVLRTVALIAVAVVSYGVGVAVGGAYGAAAAAAISIGGSMVVTSLIPVPEVKQ